MNVRHGEQGQQVCCVCCHRWNNLLRINIYLGLWVLRRNDPKLEADRPRSWGRSTAFGADVGRIDSGADRPVPHYAHVDGSPAFYTPAYYPLSRTFLPHFLSRFVNLYTAFYHMSLPHSALQHSRFLPIASQPSPVSSQILFGLSRPVNLTQAKRNLHTIWNAVQI